MFIIYIFIASNCTTWADPDDYRTAYSINLDNKIYSVVTNTLSGRNRASLNASL